MSVGFLGLASIESELTPRLVSGLYVEAMVLADEVRAYFDEQGRGDREGMSPLERVSLSCESIKVTTRLMHIIAWLLTRRAVQAGEISQEESINPDRRLGEAADSEAIALDRLPIRARSLISASLDLYQRVARLDAGLVPHQHMISPARSLFSRLEAAF